MSRDPSALTLVRQFQSETDAIREAPEPRALRVTVHTLTALIVILVVILVFTRMDRIVTSSAGKIVPTKLVNVFQTLEPSLIKTIDVRVGDQVSKGQVLATLDPTFAAADLQQLQQQIDSLDALIMRDEAELEKKPLQFPADRGGEFQKYAELQKTLYQQRAAQYRAQLGSFDAKIKQTEATLHKLEGDEGRFKQREKIAQTIENMRTTLAEKGSGSQLNMLISQDNRLEILRNLEAGHNSLIEAQHTLESLKADREAFIQLWSSTLSIELVKARNDRDVAESQLEKASKRRELVRLVAPDEGFVLTMAKLSTGSVLKPGDEFITIMPANATVEAELRVASREIGFLRPGDRCVLKVDAFDFTAHGTAEGNVLWISDGAFTLDDNNQPVEPFYKVRCGIDAMNFMNVPAHFRLVPGMTLTADIKVGTRSVAMYLLGGILRGLYELMREP